MTIVVAPERGFTLIELLAALLAGSLLLLWLGWAVAGMGELWERSSKPDPARTLAENHRVITGLIEGALYPLPTDRLEPATDRRIELLSIPPQSAASSTIARLALTVERQGDGTQALTARYRDAAAARDLTPPSRLASGWQDIHITAQVDAPDGVRPLVEIQFIAGSGEAFAILARPRINAEPGCRFDPISLECRR